MNLSATCCLKRSLLKKIAGGVDTTGNRKPVSIHGWNQPADGKDCIRGRIEAPGVFESANQRCRFQASPIDCQGRQR